LERLRHHPAASAVVTRPRNLRTGRSIWASRRALPVEHRPLANDVETDVLVIGAGITGAMVAQALVVSGLRVVIADKRGPAKGSTTASTALVQYEIDTPLVTLSRKIGWGEAVRAWRRSRLALDALAATLGELGISGVERRDSLYLAGDMLDPDGLEREGDARRAAGLEIGFLDRADLRTRFGIKADAALMGYGNLAIDPRKTTLALLNHAVALGATIYAPTDVVDVDAKRSGITAVARDGRRIQCRHLVFATGYELPDAVSKRGHKITSTWVIATVRQPRQLWPGQCLIWEASDPYLYARASPDGRVICGGEDEDVADEAARDALLHRKTTTLQRKLARRLPGLDTTIELAWTGSFGATTTGLPTIGEIPELPRCWAALGYGGNGITYARIAADVIRGALNGHPDADADLFDFR
jgi:glycine/D-amino acid oxidase-like deaminating enzyme